MASETHARLEAVGRICQDCEGAGYTETPILGSREGDGGWNKREAAAFVARAQKYTRREICLGCDGQGSTR